MLASFKYPLSWCYGTGTSSLYGVLVRRFQTGWPAMSGLTNCSTMISKRSFNQRVFLSWLKRLCSIGFQKPGLRRYTTLVTIRRYFSEPCTRSHHHKRSQVIRMFKKFSAQLRNLVRFTNDYPDCCLFSLLLLWERSCTYSKSYTS